MKRIRLLSFCAIAFMLVAAPIYMNQPAHALFINGKPVGNAVSINGVLAISLDDFAKAVGGTTNLQQAGLTVNGNRVSARDVATGLPTGKRMHKPIVITKEWSAATPLLISNGKQFLPLSELARGFGAAFTTPATLPNGAPINLHFAPNPNAAFATEH